MIGGFSLLASVFIHPEEAMGTEPGLALGALVMPEF